MKEIVSIEINGKSVVIGYSSMMAPTSVNAQNNIFKMLQLHSLEPDQSGDIFFFEYRFHDGKNQWVLLSDNGFINLEGPEKLIDLYMGMTESQNVTFEEFVEKVFRVYYWGHNPPCSETFITKCKRFFHSIFFQKTIVLS